jgi:transmembrane sensor
MTNDRLLLLIIKTLKDQMEPEETVELEIWADQRVENRQFLERMTNEEELEKEIARWQTIDPAEGYARWKVRMQVVRKSNIRRIVGWSAAASIVIVVSVISLIRTSVQPPLQQSKVMVISPVMPGRNTAVLTLSNGRKVLLDSAGAGELAVEGKTVVKKVGGGSLSYSVGQRISQEAIVYNILTTPRSGQYQLTLPDGSHVWLNSESSIKYPTSFLEKNRLVELTGEAYFEIANHPSQPFIVKVNGQEVEVLGTGFNVMAYPDEPEVQTTVLTGAVKVKDGSAVVQLRPDEQAQSSGGGRIHVLTGVPSQDIVSWKDGFFYFGRASLKEVMRQLARWYDVEVRYEGTVPDVEFGGKIDRSLSLNDLLKFLNKNQVHFRLEGRVLIVLPS